VNLAHELVRCNEHRAWAKGLIPWQHEPFHIGRAEMEHACFMVIDPNDRMKVIAGAVLITGPANAKTELVKHISQHDSRLMRIIVGVETVDHPSDGQLVAHARHYFKAEDRMLPQKD
jgi:hypothetical protein